MYTTALGKLKISGPLPKRDIEAASAMRKQSDRIEDSRSERSKWDCDGGGKAHVIPFPKRARVRDNRKLCKRLTILIVEDHGSLCDMLSLYFMRYGYHVRTATDGESALDVLSSERIHLVLLDLMLPRLDGFAVLRQIRRRWGQSIPYVIVVSAGASSEDRDLVFKLGANEYLAKPFHLVSLLERIQKVERHLVK